jgi:hypothetical protein
MDDQLDNAEKKKKSYLDGDFSVIEVNDYDVAKPLCLCVAIVTGNRILGKHL